MATLHITTKDERTKVLLIDLLHAMQGVEVRETKSSSHGLQIPDALIAATAIEYK